MQRIYENILLDHFERLSQMAFLAGPRQVGKSTIAQHLLQHKTGIYLNWDIVDDRALILSGHRNIMQKHAPARLGQTLPITVLDEIHKFKDWKNYLKGFYDDCKNLTKILVTGSSRLDIFLKGGDSLMGRYFPYNVHPLSVSELLKRTPPSTHTPLSEPHQIADQDWQTLWQYGGFPDPFIQNNQKFFNQWQNLRHQQLFKEDIVDLSQVSDIAQLEVLALMIQAQAGQIVQYTSLGKAIRSSDQTIRRWLDLLESVYYCFRVRPWFNNVSRSLKKDPKIFLWDWSTVKNEGAKAENFIASHLRTSIDLWNQLGLGQFELFYVRDKEKNEVDFLVTREQQPWFLAEVKKSPQQALSPALAFFQKQLNAPHAFQITLDDDFVDADCFAHHHPILVPAKTFLSQI